MVRERLVQLSMPLQASVLQKRQAVISTGRDWRAPGLSADQRGVTEFCGGLRRHLSVDRHLSASYPLAGHADRV